MYVTIPRSGILLSLPIVSTDLLLLLALFPVRVLLPLHH